MTEGDDPSHRFLPPIRQELDKLRLTDEERELFAEQIANNAKFITLYADKFPSATEPADGSGFHFADKVQAVVDRFRDSGFTTTDYLKALIRRPDILAVSPNVIIRNVEGVVDLFSADGLTTKEYLKAAVRQPSLFIQTPWTLSGNITGLVERFANEGLTDREYLNAALKQPSLFTLSPATAESNIRAVVERFRNDGMTLPGYLNAAVRIPPLFSMRPETVAGHIDAIMDLAERRIFVPPARRIRQGHAGNSLRSSVIDFLMSNPRLLALADDNFGVREVHQVLTNGPTDRKVLETPRHRIERELMAHLGHDDPSQPVEADGFVAGAPRPTEEQAKRFLLRALLHAGYIKGGSMER